MVRVLFSCPSCARHIRTTEVACPFCGGVVAEGAGAIPARAWGGPAPMTRAAILLATAAVTAGCGKETKPPETSDAGMMVVNLRDAGVIITCNTQINRLSMTELPKILDRMIAVGARAWQIQLTVPMGRAADEPDVLLQPFDLDEVFPMLAELIPRARASGIEVVSGNNIGYFGPYENILRGRTLCGHSSGCGAGRVSMGIEADGTIKGCPSLATSTWSGGTVRERSLREIWERATALRYTRDRTTTDLWGFCATCYYADDCKAGCTWTADSLFGKPGNNPYCHHRVLEMKRAGTRERVVRVEEAPGEPFDRGKFELIVEPWA